MKIRFQADANFNQDIVAGVLRRLPEIDFQTSNEAKLHFGRFIQIHTSPGVLVVSQKAEVLRIIEDLILIWFASDAEEYFNSIRTLPL